MTTNITELKRTPLYKEHQKLKARLVPFAGWEMPVQYTGILEEHAAVRTKAGLFDVSHMGEFEVSGKNAEDFLQKMMTNEIEGAESGRAIYTFMCYENGGTVDDLIVYKFSKEHFLICVNASNIEKDFDWLNRHKPKDVNLQNKSDETCLLALQGPEAQDIFSAYLEKHHQNRPSLKSFHFTEMKTPLDCIVARTGYTGELGYEFFVKNEQADVLWRELLEVGQKWGLKPVGLGARDTLRLEMGYPLYGHELNQDTSPLEANLPYFVKLEKKYFLGKEKMLEQKEKGCSKYLVPLELIERGIARQDHLVYSATDIHPIGRITSGTQSPTLRKSIALGFIKSEFKNEKEFLVEIRGKKVKAKKVTLPFYRHGG